VDRYDIQCNLRVVSAMYTKYLQSPLYSPPPSRTALLASPFPSPSPSRFPRAAAASHLAVPRMWGGTDGGTPEVTLETSMGAITVEVPSHPTYRQGAPLSLGQARNSLGSIRADASLFAESRYPARPLDVLQARAQDLPELRRARAPRLLRQRHLPPHHQGLSFS